MRLRYWLISFLKKWRYGLVIFCFAFFYFLLIDNLYKLQIEKSTDYSVRAISQFRALGILKPERGNIYFTDKNNNKNPAALNKEFDIIFAVPKEIHQKGGDIKEYAKALSPIIGISEEKIEKKLKKKNDLYELLLKRATKEQIIKIKDLKLTGIYFDREKERYYPFSTLAAHIIGFVSPPNSAEKDEFNLEIGRYGIEKKFDNQLRGEAGRIEEKKIIQAKDGQDVILTIDSNVQTQAEEVLKKTILKWKAKSGTIIIQEATTGRIIALANYPTFDPNRYFQSPIKNYLNLAVSGMYEFGSVFKVITMAAGIDSGKISPSTTYYDKGYVILNGKKIQNWGKKVYGKISMREVLEHSVNTGAVFAEKMTGHKIFFDYLKKFGFGEKTGIELPGEIKGSLKTLVKGKDINYATASFGQGISVTAIQLINAFSAILNEGVLNKPLILKNEKPQPIRQVIKKETAKTIIEMMESVAEKNNISIPYYRIAGKTGTAYIPDFEKGGYTDKVINTFIGFLSLEGKQRYVILVKIDEPEGQPFANQTVSPAFLEIAKFMINYYELPPDKKEENKL